MNENRLNRFDIIIFIYFFVGTVCGALIQYTEIDFIILTIISMMYLYTFLWSFFVYLLYGCILYPHKGYLRKVIDCILCYCLTFLYPFPICNFIYEFNKYLYYSLGGLFSFLPLIFCKIDSERINFSVIFTTVTRIFMIIFAGLIILMLRSCGSGIAG